MLRSLPSIAIFAIIMCSCSGSGLFNGNKEKSTAFNGNSVVVSADLEEQPSGEVTAEVTGDVSDENPEVAVENELETGKATDTDEEVETGKTKNGNGGKCDKQLDGKSAVKLNGNQNTLTVSSDQYFEAKINGNQSTLNLTLSSEDPEAKLSGACLFLTGNMAKATINVSANVGIIHIITRGNQAKVEITVEEGSVVDQLRVDQKGKVVDITTSGTISEKI